LNNGTKKVKKYPVRYLSKVLAYVAAKNLGKLNAVPLRNDTRDEARAWDWHRRFRSVCPKDAETL